MNTQELRNLLFFNSAAVLRNLLGLIRAKVITLWFGVSAVGILGQILSIFNLQTRLVDLGVYALLNNKIGKLSNLKKKEQYSQLLLISILILVFSNIIISSIMLIFAKVLSEWLFDSPSYSILIILLAFINPIFSIGYFYETLVRAHRSFRKLAYGQNLTNIVGILSIFPILKLFGVKGVIYNFYIFLGFNVFFLFLQLVNIYQSYISNTSILRRLPL